MRQWKKYYIKGLIGLYILSYFFKTIFNEMTIYILKGCSASQNKLLIIYMKLDQIKGLNYHKISSTHPNNTTNKCWANLGATDGILKRDVCSPHEQRPRAMALEGNKGHEETHAEHLSPSPVSESGPLRVARTQTYHSQHSGLLLAAQAAPMYFGIAYHMLLLWLAYLTSQIVGSLSSCHRMSYMSLAVREIFLKGAK